MSFQTGSGVAILLRVVLGRLRAGSSRCGSTTTTQSPGHPAQGLDLALPLPGRPGRGRHPREEGRHRRASRATLLGRVRRARAHLQHGDHPGREGPVGARYDASGWRQVVTQVGGARHVHAVRVARPALPSSASRPTAPPPASTPPRRTPPAPASTHTRPPLMLNQWRVYDPLLGAYLQPDGLDRSGRTDPEQYTYARARGTTLSDPTGQESIFPRDRPRVDCDPLGERVASAINRAAIDLFACISRGECRDPLGRLGIQSLLTAAYTCQPTALRTFFQVEVISNGRFKYLLWEPGVAISGGVSSPDLNKIGLSIRPYVLDETYTGCPSAQAMHEALHLALFKVSPAEVLGLQPTGFGRATRSLAGTFSFDDVKRRLVDWFSNGDAGSAGRVLLDDPTGLDIEEAFVNSVVKSCSSC
jgi:RHS repeat-associated protein